MTLPPTQEVPGLSTSKRQGNGGEKLSTYFLAKSSIPHQRGKHRQAGERPALHRHRNREGKVRPGRRCSQPARNGPEAGRAQRRPPAWASALGRGSRAPRCPHHGVISRSPGPCSHEHFHTHIDSSVIHNGQNVGTTQCPSADKRTKTRHLGATGYHSALTRK